MSLTYAKLRNKKCPICGGRYNLKFGLIRDGKKLWGKLDDPYVRCEFCGWEGLYSQLLEAK